MSEGKVGAKDDASPRPQWMLRRRVIRGESPGTLSGISGLSLIRQVDDPGVDKLDLPAAEGTGEGQRSGSAFVDSRSTTDH